jgi:hypothetical protein
LKLALAKFPDGWQLSTNELKKLKKPGLYDRLVLLQAVAGLVGQVAEPSVDTGEEEDEVSNADPVLDITKASSPEEDTDDEDPSWDPPATRSIARTCGNPAAFHTCRG